VPEWSPAESALFAAQSGAIQQFLDGVSLPLYSATPELQQPVGTGTLIRVRDSVYLVTAAHVLQRCLPGTIALPLDRRFRAVSTLGPYRVNRSAKDEHDVALIRLDDPNTVDRLSRSWTVLGTQHLSAPLSSGPFLVHGYQEPAKQAREGLCAPGRRLRYVGARYQGPLASSADPLDPEYDLLVDLGAASLDLLSRKELETPRFQGVSGASVWEMIPTDPRRVWTAESQLKLVAIQSGALHFQYLRAKRWHLLWAAFRDFDPRAGRDVRTSITRSITARRQYALRKRKGPSKGRSPDRA
jgi:hypothetical protein